MIKRNIGNIVAAVTSMLTLAACGMNNVTNDDMLKTVFDKYHVSGTFAVHNNITNRFDIYNLNRYRDSSYAPGATFNIVNALFGVEKGVINNPLSTFSQNPAISSISLKSSFLSPAQTYNEYLAAQIGKGYMQTWLDSLHYGTYKIKNDSTSFWTNDSLKLTPDEQLGFMKKLYFDQLPFQKRTLNMVKQLLVRKENTNYTLCYQQSAQLNTKGELIGWVIGWEEENKHVYFFTLNLTAPQQTPLLDIQPKMLEEILASKGFFKGNK